MTTTRNRGPVQPVPGSNDRFRAALAALDLTLPEFGKLAGLGRSTVHGWGDCVPAWAFLLLEAWQAAPHVLSLARARHIVG